MFKKLSRAIEGYQRANPIDDVLVNELLIKAPKLLRDCPATVHFTGYDDTHPSWKVGSTILAVKLNEHEELAKKSIESIVSEIESQGEEVLTHELDGFAFQSTQAGAEGRFYFGIVEGNLVLSFGAIEIEETLANLKSPAPEVVQKNKASEAVDRPFVTVYADITKLLESAKPEMPEGVYETLKLEEIEAVSAAIGLDQSGMVSSFFIKCPENPTGIISSLDGQGIDKASVADMPNDSISSMGASLPLTRIWQQMQAVGNLSPAGAEIADSIETIENLSDLKFSEEILDSFDGTIFAYQKVTNASLMAFRVKDKDLFAKRLSTCMKSIRIEAEAIEGGEFKEKQYKDYTIYSFTQPVYLGPSLSWCHADDQFYVGMNANMISGHLRRRGRTRGRLIDEDRFNQTFDMGEAKGWGKPIAFSYIDISTTMQMLVPLGRTFLGGQEIEGFDFSFDDVPSVDVLVNGVEHNVIAMFRTPDGIQGIERSTVPGVSSVGTTGLLAGLMLPAVQATRAAARRVTALNYLRQLQLAVLVYESDNGRFPAAYSTDAAGKPLLSWRVLILPYLDQQELYNKFHLDEPWDSPHNIELLDQMPDLFRNPNSVAESGKATFLAVAGQNGAFPGPKGLKLAEFTDGTSNTISIVDVNAQHAVNWTQPGDLDPAEHKRLLNVTSGTATGVDAMVVLVDGATRELRNADEETLRQLMNRKDGEGVID